MKTKFELLKTLGWSDEQLNHFLIEDVDTIVSAETSNEIEVFESVTTETRTISFQFGMADTSKVILKK